MRCGCSGGQWVHGTDQRRCGAVAAIRPVELRGARNPRGEFQVGEPGVVVLFPELVGRPLVGPGGQFRVRILRGGKRRQQPGRLGFDQVSRVEEQAVEQSCPLRVSGQMSQDVGVGARSSPARARGGHAVDKECGEQAVDTVLVTALPQVSASAAW